MKREWLALLSAVQFLTRLPVPDPGWEDGRLDRAAKWFPLVGVLVGLLCGAVFFVLLSFVERGVPHIEIAVLFGVLITGALHEDGFADTADGFFGGRSAEKRLTIMRDSRIGTYGAIALVFALLLRISLYGEFFSPLISNVSYTATVAAAFIAAHAVSRCLILWHVSAIPYARADETPPMTAVSKGSAMTAGLITLGACLPLALSVSLGAVAMGLLLAGASAFAFTRMAKARVNGWSGDTAGATQVISELCFLMGFAAWIWS